MMRVRALLTPAVLLGLLLAGPLSGPARSFEPASASSVPRTGIPEIDGVDEPRTYCTPFGCAGRSRSPLGLAVGFGAAALAAGWLGRRRFRTSRR